jgi:hypothetical protein
MRHLHLLIGMSTAVGSLSCGNDIPAGFKTQETDVTFESGSPEVDFEMVPVP